MLEVININLFCVSFPYIINVSICIFLCKTITSRVKKMKTINRAADDLQLIKFRMMFLDTTYNRKSKTKLCKLLKGKDLAR